MGLQIDRDTRFHRRERVLQRIGMLLVAAMVGAGLFGLSGGPGVLGTPTSSDPGGLLELRYQRFLHRETDYVITLTVPAAAVLGDRVDLELATSWVDAVEVNGIVPEPSEQVRIGEGLLLRIATQPGLPVTVRISYQVSRTGSLGGWARLPDARVSFSQFAFP